MEGLHVKTRVSMVVPYAINCGYFVNRIQPRIVWWSQKQRMNDRIMFNSSKRLKNTFHATINWEFVEF